MPNELKVYIQGVINKANFVRDINSQLKELQSSIRPIDVKINLDDTTKSLRTLTGQMSEISKMANQKLQVFDVKDSENGIRTIKKSLEEALDYYKQFGTISVNKSINPLTKELQGFTLSIKKADESVEKLKFNLINLADGSNITKAFKLNDIKVVDKTQEIREKNLQTEQLMTSAVEKRAAKEEEAARKAAQTALRQREAELQYEHSTRKAIEEKISKEKEQVVQLEHILNLYKQQAQINVDEHLRRYGSKADSDGLNSYLKSVNGLTAQTPQLRREMDLLDLGFRKIRSSVDTSKSHFEDMTKQFGVAMQRIPLWMGAMTLFYFPLRAFQQGIEYISNLDAAMVDLKKVTNETDASYSKFAKGAANTANEIGGLTLDVIKSTSEWARLGYTLEQSAMIAKQATIYQNVGDIKDATQASTDLISAIKGFNIEIDSNGQNMTHLIDVYNAVGNKYSISSAGIGEAAKRSASALHEAGNTMEESIALITGANASVQDPSKVGNALKSISLRLHGISEDGKDVSNLVPTLEKKFNSMGLSLKENETTFKSTYQIFSDIHNVFDSLNGLQKSDLLQLIAGKENANVAASLIANFKDAQGALKTGLNSFGSAAKENQTVIESLAGHVKRFQNEVNSFWSSNMTSNALKQIVDLGTSAVGVLSKLTDTFGGLNLIVLATSASLLKFSGSGKALVSSITSMVPMFNSLNSYAERLSIANQRASTTSSMLGVNLNGLKLAMIGTRIATAALETTMTLGLSVAITAVVSGLTYLYQKYQDNVQIQRELEQQQNLVAENWSNHKNKIQELLAEYEKLSEATNNGKAFSNSEQEQRYKEVIQSIADIMPNLVKDTNEHGEATLKTAAAIQEEIKNTEILISLKREQQVIDAEASLKKQTDAVDDLQKQKAKLELQLRTGRSGETSYSGLLTESEIIAKKIQIEGLKSKVNESSVLIRQELDSLSRAFLSTWDIKLPDNLSEGISKIASSIETQGLDPQALKEKGIQLATFFHHLTALKDMKAGTSQFVDMQAQVFTFGRALNLTDVEIDKYISSLNDLSSTQQNGNQSSIDFKKIMDALPKAFDDAVKPLKELNQALKDVNEGHSLTSDAVASLVAQYPALASAIHKTADGYTIEKGALEAVRKEQIQHQVDTLKTESGITDTVLIELKTRLQAYGIELDQIKTLDDARKAAAGILTSNPDHSMMEKLPQVAQDYFNNVSKGADQAKTDLLKYGSVVEAVNKLEELMKDRTFGTNKSNTPAAGPQLKDSLARRDLTKSLIDAYNDEYIASEKIVASLDRQIKTAERSKDMATVVALTTKKIEEQIKAVEALQKAQAGFHVEADKLRKDNPMYKIDEWFNAQNGPSKLYEKLLDDLSKKSEKVKNDNSLTVKARNKANDDIKKQQDAIVKLFTQLQTYRDAWKQAGDNIVKANDGLYDTQQAMTNIQTTLKDNTVKWSDDLKVKAQDALNIIEEFYKRQGDSAQKSLDKQLSDYKAYIDDRKNLLNRDTSTEDFNKKKDKLQKEQLEIQKKVDAYSLDNSIEGKFKRQEAEKELATKTEEIQQLDLDRTKVLREQNYDDLLANKEKEIKTSKDAAEKKWQADLQADKTYTKLREALLQGNADNMQSILKEFSKNVQGYMDDIGKSIDLNLVDRMNTLDKFRTIRDKINETPNKPSLWTPDVQSVIDKMKNNSLSWKNEPSNRLTYQYQNQLLGNSINATYDSKSGVWTKNGIPLYHQGGIVGEAGSTTKSFTNKLLNSDEVLTIMRKKEAIIDKPLDFMRDVVGHVVGHVKQSLSINSPRIPATEVTSGVTNYNFDVRIDKLLGGKEGADSFFGHIKYGLQTGKYN